ncbi:MAG TPA: hypothetical protein DCE44_00500 [Verrucomicrobiales bacterium]|nr:hypothetical protein [Verrucomicrobiales bacterium]
MNRFCWCQRLASLAASLAVAAGVGYRWRDLQEKSATALGVAEIAPLESFVGIQSFSEIQNTRAELQGLAQRFRTEARMKYLASLSTSLSQSTSAVERQSIVRDLERGIEEFKDTPEELVLIEDLLLQLRSGGQANRWLDVYLEVLYRRPTEDLVASQFVTARQMAQATDRESEVATGFQHLLGIPLDFPAKRLLKEQESRAMALDQPREVSGSMLFSAAISAEAHRNPTHPD